MEQKNVQIPSLFMEWQALTFTHLSIGGVEWISVPCCLASTVLYERGPVNGGICAYLFPRLARLLPHTGCDSYSYNEARTSTFHLLLSLHGAHWSINSVLSFNKVRHCRLLTESLEGLPLVSSFQPRSLKTNNNQIQ